MKEVLYFIISFIRTITNTKEERKKFMIVFISPYGSTLKKLQEGVLVKLTYNIQFQVCCIMSITLGTLQAYNVPSVRNILKFKSCVLCVFPDRRDRSKS